MTVVQPTILRTHNAGQYFFEPNFRGNPQVLKFEEIEMREIGLLRVIFTQASLATAPDFESGAFSHSIRDSLSVPEGIDVAQIGIH
jgi:hypothetical protein